jgi:hypothetical protein
MSLSTTCYTYFVDTFDDVTGNSTDQATCDSSYIDCTINSNDIPLTCDSTLQTNPVGADSSASEYFCVCNGGVKLSIPEIVTCASFCLDLSTKEQCNFLTLYDGAIEGNADVDVEDDECDMYGCDSEGIICTTDGYTSYQCDNAEHEIPGPDASLFYVCNCFGPAEVPSQFASNGYAQGTACGNAANTIAMTSSFESTPTDSSGSATTDTFGATTTESSGTTSSTASATSSPAQSHGVKKGLLGLGIIFLLGVHG